MLDTVTREMFEKQLEGTFVVSVEGAELDMQLVYCRGLTADPEQGRRDPFSAVFRGPMEPVLEQQIYEVKHEAIGSLEIFLVPIGPAKGGMQYEAVFT